MSEPSPMQLEVLRVIRDHVADRGYPPTVREIGEALRLASPSTVHAHLRGLERAGCIYRDPAKPRAITVEPEPRAPLVLLTDAEEAVYERAQRYANDGDDMVAGLVAIVDRLTERVADLELDNEGLSRELEEADHA